MSRTGQDARRIVAWADRDGLALDDDDYFVRLRAGKRVMVLRHEAGACRFLDESDRCGIYAARPLGCRIFPFDPRFDRRGKLRRLELIPATDCRYALDGENDAAALRRLSDRHDDATERYLERVAAWNRAQAARAQSGLQTQSAVRFFEFLGVAAPLGTRHTAPADLPRRTATLTRRRGR